MPKDWVRAIDGLKLLERIFTPQEAIDTIRRRLQAGLVNARAKQLHIGIETRLSDEDIPRQFWHGAFEAENWASGDFVVWLVEPQPEGSVRRRSWQAFDVRFDRRGISDLIKGGISVATAKPSSLPAQDLADWLSRLPESDQMSQLEIWDAAKAAFPNHRVSRDSIRHLTPGRKPGPKQFGGTDVSPN